MDYKSKTFRGWALLSIGAVLVSFGAGVAWGIPAAIAVAGGWTIAYGIGSLLDA